MEIRKILLQFFYPWFLAKLFENVVVQMDQRSVLFKI